MFENLSERLDRSFKLLKGEGKITEINVAETLKDVRKALLDADVNYKVAKGFTDTVKAKALGQNVLTSVKPSQLMVKIVHDELADLMGGTATDLDLKGSPAIILMSGLQGSGKTTFSGKLANLLKTKKNKKPLLAACDVYRPAAIEQLRVVGEQVGVPVYMELENKNPVEIAMNAIREARAKGNDVVIVDTAGRLAIDEQMMKEIAAIKSAIQPDETLFVVDSMTGQDAVNTAKEFNERLDFDGVVLTKLDGDTRGGAALSIRTVVDKPIKFVGTGEKMDALDIFHGDGVRARERFVEQDELGIDGHCPCYFGTAPFTARQLDTLAFAYFLQAELLDEVFHPFALILLGVVGHFEYRPDVVLDAEVAEDRCLLCEVAYTHLCALVHRQFGYLFRPLFAFEEYLSVVGLDEPYYHVEGSGLSGTVRAQQTDYLPLIDVDGHLIDDGARLIFFDESGGVKPHFFKKLFYKVSQILEKVLSLCCERMLGIIVRSFRAFYIVTSFGVFYSWGTHDFGILACMEAVSARRAGTVILRREYREEERREEDGQFA